MIDLVFRVRGTTSIPIDQAGFFFIEQAVRHAIDEHHLMLGQPEIEIIDMEVLDEMMGHIEEEQARINQEWEAIQHDRSVLEAEVDRLEAKAREMKR